MNQNTPLDEPVGHAVHVPPLTSRQHDEALLDQAVAQSFPASDPISPAVQARLEAADVSFDESLVDQTESALGSRMRRAMPALIAIGTAAVALLAMRALRRGRH